MDSARFRYFVFALSLAYWTPLVPPASGAQKVALQPQRRQGELARVELTLQVGGQLKLVHEQKPTEVPMSVVADQNYDERILSLDAGRPNRSLRWYRNAQAVIKVDQGGQKPTLPPQRRLIAVEKLAKAPTVLFSPTSPLGREELDLLDVPGNSLVVDQLLPQQPVALGESWKLADQALADLLVLDKVGWSDVQAVLGEVKDNLADIAAAGSVHGAVGGISTEIELKAKYKFDLETKRIVFVALLIKEKRAVGHVGPGLDTVAKLLMKISPLDASPQLDDAQVQKVANLKTPEHALLAYESPGSGFRFEHDRRWFVTSDDKKLTVLRLLDKGELVAQCNVSALPSTAKGVSLAEFQRDVEVSLGKNFGRFVGASQTTTPSGYHVYRVVATGVVSQLTIEWVYYLVADDQGHRVTLSFTLEEGLQERFGEADRAIVERLRLPAPAAATAARPAEKKK